MPHVDLAFRVTGTMLAVDRGYALYPGISRVFQSTDIPSFRIWVNLVEIDILGRVR